MADVKLKIRGSHLALLLISFDGFAQPPPNFILGGIPEKYSHTSASPCSTSREISQFTLPELILVSLCSDPTLANAIAASLQAREDVAIAKGAYFPMMDLTSNWGKVHRTTKYDGLSESIQTNATSTAMQGTISWLLFDSGLRSARLDDAKENLNAALFTRQYAVKKTAYEVSRRFYSVILKRESLAAYFEAEKVAKRGQEVAQARYNAGVGLYSNKLLSDSNFAEATLSRVTAEGEYVIAQTELSSYVLQDGGRKINLLYPERQLTLSDEMIANIENTIVDGKTSNLRISAAQARVRAAQAKADAIRAEGRPTVAVVLAANDDRSQPTGYVGQRNRSASATLQVRIPLIEGFTRSHRVGGAEAFIDSQRAQLKEVERDVDLTTWTAFNRLKSETFRLKSAQALFLAASTSLLTAQGRFEAGVGDIFELFKAEQDISRSGQQLATSKYEYRMALLQLHLELDDLDISNFPP